MVTNKTQTRLRQGGNAVDCPVVLRKVMKVLSVKGFTKASIADLTSAAGVNYTALHKAFGTREDIYAPPSSFAPMRKHHSLKSRYVQHRPAEKQFLRCWRRMCGCGGAGPHTVDAFFTFNAFIVPPDDPSLQDFLTEKRRSLLKQRRSRLVRSVTEGQLSEYANCEALANLCVTLLSGLTFRVLDGVPPSLLFRSLEVFVNALGFAPRRGRGGPLGARRVRGSLVR